ncbi:sensor histidine kinase [Microbacterium paraoxydans]|uniref:sensor histidine kinase n=1 Tax=Microbacterium paraoxydans TaxID=199592 RepID=UPI001CFA604F|nr:HAMP domain-containing sensor histidine kinase [Microbacterium paraoxydans]
MTRPKWTLRRKLVVSSAALVAVGLIVTSVTTILALRSFLYERLDAQVLGALDLATGPNGGFGGPPEPNGGDPGAGDGGPAQRVGSLQIVLDSGGHVTSSSYTATDGTEVELSSTQRDVIEGLDLETRTPISVELGGELGAFRIAAQPDDGETVIAGVSLGDARATTAALTVILVSVAALTILLVATALSLVVRRNLRPLDRVAGVAQRVAGQPLSEGDVEIADRVEARDIDPHTEVGRVGISLNTLLGHIEAALAARQYSEEQLRRFIADASHELRTPLASIRGYAQLSLGEGVPMTPTQERSLDRIAAESERMSSLVDDLLLLARLDAGQALRRDPVSLTLLAIDATSDAHAADDSHEWRLDVSEEQVEVTGDENRIRQVIANLLRNARTHTPPGTVVTTLLTADGAEAVLEVSDNGPGIDPSVQHRLFERFARGDHSRNRDAGSTGLGLSIAHAIVTAHGGSITVRSEPGDTVFTVRLPL